MRIAFFLETEEISRLHFAGNGTSIHRACLQVQSLLLCSKLQIVLTNLNVTIYLVRRKTIYLNLRKRSKNRGVNF